MNADVEAYDPIITTARRRAKDLGVRPMDLCILLLPGGARIVTRDAARATTSPVPDYAREHVAASLGGALRALKVNAFDPKTHAVDIVNLQRLLGDDVAADEDLNTAMDANAVAG
jgi:hypothetical protein